VLLVHLVAVVHALAVVLLVTGGLLALRHRGLLWVHLPVAGAIAAVYLAGADCPLTSLELALRADAGAELYDGGFLEHYLLSPLGLDRGSTGTQLALVLTAVLPNVAACTVLATRRSRGSATSVTARSG
jgi:hypothetical protein